MNYAPPGHWDKRFEKMIQRGEDLDWGNQWIGAFLEPLQKVNANLVLDLGCGSGNDVIRLVNAGFQAVGMDYSQVAVGHAIRKIDGDNRFVIGDMSQRLPFRNSVFEAVMSNVAAHMFSDAITRSLFKEIRRILKPGGLFLFHLNALEDRPLRAVRWPPVQELEPNFVLEEHGQTMRFFSEVYLRELLAEWAEVELILVDIPDRKTGMLFKRAWRGIASK